MTRVLEEPGNRRGFLLARGPKFRGVLVLPARVGRRGLSGQGAGLELPHRAQLRAQQMTKGACVFRRASLNRNAFGIMKIA